MNGRARDGRPPRLTRREALVLAATTPLATLAACRSEPEPEPGTVIPLASLPVGERVRVLHGELPVELLRQADGTVTARSLWCTHMGCEIHWQPEASQYVCPCHDGRFDADGRPVAGPPTRPLRRLAPILRGDRLILPLESV